MSKCYVSCLAGLADLFLFPESPHLHFLSVSLLDVTFNVCSVLNYEYSFF